MTIEKANPPKQLGIDTVAKYAAVASAFASGGNFLLGLLGFGGVGEAGIVALQGLAATVIIIAFLIFLIDWERKRDKWPGRLNELTIKIAPVAISDAKYLTPEFSRYVILVYREYHRMALAEGRVDLEKDFKKEIKTWQKTLKESEAIFD